MGGVTNSWISQPRGIRNCSLVMEARNRPNNALNLQSNMDCRILRINVVINRCNLFIVWKRISVIHGFQHPTSCGNNGWIPQCFSSPWCWIIYFSIHEVWLYTVVNKHTSTECIFCWYKSVTIVRSVCYGHNKCITLCQI